MTEVSRTTAERWLQGYKGAWENRDPAAAGRLFTPEATYRETPFEAAFEGRSAIERYWAGAVAGQRDVRFTSEVLACSGQQALAHWHVAFTVADGDAQVELDGIFRLWFASEELVERFEEWWHVRT